MELLSPAGDITKLRYALDYGADAVYASGHNFGLRSRSRNFSAEELREAVKLVHGCGEKIYITLNIFAHNADLRELPAYMESLALLGVDAFIISDPGVFALARKHAPLIPIHISTQANVTSWSSVMFWRDQGAKRIILARELSLREIGEIRDKVSDIELEMFVHGAMCMSYSGRCLLSAYLNGRNANQGDCSQPCRWEYFVKERSRPNENFTIEEDSRGSYIFNSKDLCLLPRIPELFAAGIDSLKIEGRMKSLYYVANVTRIYREAMDLVSAGLSIPEELTEELNKVSHRVYAQGFVDGLDSMSRQHYESSAYIRDYQFLGEITGYEPGWITVNVKAKFSIGEEVELMFPERGKDDKIEVVRMINELEEQISFTKPNTKIKIEIEKEYPVSGILRKRISTK